MYSDSKITLIFRGVAFSIDTMFSAAITMIIVEFLKGDPAFETMTLVIITAFVLLILRDIFGKSIGKYLLGMTIIDSNNKNNANFYQRILKNITVPVTIIEIPIIIFTKSHKKIGDRLAKTETVINENSYALTIFNSIIQ